MKILSNILLIPIIGWLLYFVAVFMITNIFMPISGGIIGLFLLLVPFCFFLGMLFHRCYNQSVTKLHAIICSMLFFVISSIPVWIAFAISERINKEDFKYLLPGYVINILPLAVVAGGLAGLIYLGIIRFMGKHCVRPSNSK